MPRTIKDVDVFPKFVTNSPFLPTAFSSRYLLLHLLPLLHIFISLTMHFTTASVLAIMALAPTALAGSYKLADEYVGEKFLSGFVHQNIQDPTQGRVFVNLSSNLLIYAHDHSQHLCRPGYSVEEQPDLRSREHDDHARGL
jgi:hypothetical protein